MSNSGFECPLCKKEKDCLEYLNNGRTHYGVCRECGVFWNIGENLFSTWRYETPNNWKENREYLEKLIYVEPFVKLKIPEIEKMLRPEESLINPEEEESFFPGDSYPDDKPL